MPSLFFFYPRNFLWENTINLAIGNIAKKIDYEYQKTTYINGYRNNLNDTPKNPDCKIAFFEHNPNFNNSDFEIVKDKFPNAKIVMFGSDTIYYGGGNAICWPIDLLIDTMKRVVKETTKCSAEHYYWSVSETIIEEIQKTELEKEKIWKLISLCRDASNERAGFFQRIKDSGCDIHWNLKLYNPTDIYKAYSRSWFALGHTTPVFSAKDRSMKGFRDWISPFCNTVLIYDDYPDILDIGNDTIPIYRYLDQNEVVKLIEKLGNDLKLYNEYIEKQRVWAIANTLEKQILNIITKHNFI